MDAAMSGIKGKRPLGDANEQRFNDRLQTDDDKRNRKLGCKRLNAAKNTTSRKTRTNGPPERTPCGRVAGGA
ncbi:hypothetical protein PTKU64_16170 [Paraburkholderia terrae]|uniref:Uncharacterized protein n=1 Tax=Paraburkholderia terrae TaxID=311230 RepID=A0ABM7TSP8_9BURK|nr:hypothetical protein PTKU64_16170 [Paraburkholderia terrae]